MATELTQPSAIKWGAHVELIPDDDIPMETGWHLFCMQLLIDSIHQYYRGRDDFFAAGNQFIYFNERQARDRDFRGPDFYLVLGAPREPLRQFWYVWQEGGRYPNVIIELTSPGTAHLDRGIKKDTYERVFRTPNYFCYDPATDTLEGWQLRDNGYEAIPPNERGWLWCSQAQLWVGAWQGRFRDFEQRWLRFYRPDGVMVPTADEAANERAEAALRELAQLKARLASQNGSAGAESAE